MNQNKATAADRGRLDLTISNQFVQLGAPEACSKASVCYGAGYAMRERNDCGPHAG
ncbi:hypothetical protein [Bradyrhizobium sp. STM 3557]|uniref:hypothetical protein n=1 Tax=Bradyrhizobium sp. STM 3557 TaxID=578920 RepID=UPI00388CEF26